MNRTDDEPRTEADVMATAFSTMRKYGMNILTATQHMDINAYVENPIRGCRECGCAATWASTVCAVRR